MPTVTLTEITLNLQPFQIAMNSINGKCIQISFFTFMGRSLFGGELACDRVGFATEDFSALRYVHDKIRGTNLYQNLDLLADPDDPRDLFGMLDRRSASLKVA